MGKPDPEAPRPPSIPSAPVDDDEHQGASSSSTGPVSPVNTSPPPNYGATQENQPSSYQPQTHQMGPQGHQSMPPPPSYDDAVNCPAPPYLPSGAPKIDGPQHGRPIYPPPPISGTGYVLQAPADAPNQQARVIHTTTVITPVAGTACIHCLVGQVQNETDLCCLLCLILFAIFTFPMGLVLLCCIPCTVRQRCSRCRRLQ
ncbi:unnamed protein product [Bursaphelenchus okinawaensis]|uniref:Membrane protein BRI3 n=1 Tax=Bursaphelenchus okinawaensis TaxID=465554 RepID=A0A811K932_9BILA|nr:unnamed protein product [Bursaphelenchus okinawaensis]CAG9094632.1 unnamed protein product [Bursaphelenchus okinawaensis]